MSTQNLTCSPQQHGNLKKWVVEDSPASRTILVPQQLQRIEADRYLHKHNELTVSFLFFWMFVHEQTSSFYPIYILFFTSIHTYKKLLIDIMVSLKLKSEKHFVPTIRRTASDRNCPPLKSILGKSQSMEPVDVSFV